MQDLSAIGKVNKKVDTKLAGNKIDKMANKPIKKESIFKRILKKTSKLIPGSIPKFWRKITNKTKK